MNKIIIITIFQLLSVSLIQAQKQSLQLKSDTSNVQFRAIAEIGYLAALSHKVQLGQDGTYFNYVKDGGQDVLFPVSRFSLEMDFNKRNTIILLYQPLRIETQALLREDVIFNGTAFAGSTGIKALYNFPFYRISYLRKLKTKNPNFELAIGASLQIRNATISFESTDGQKYTDNRGIGPVPVLKIRSRTQFSPRFFGEFEADGFYAPVSYLNGDNNEIIGAILDSSVRFGANIFDSGNIFFNLRYLGGGAVGTDDGDVWPGDGYVKNWLHFLTVSTGFAYGF
jgi:hypothetical protein